LSERFEIQPIQELPMDAGSQIEILLAHRLGPNLRCLFAAWPDAGERDGTDRRRARDWVHDWLPERRDALEPEQATF